MFRYNSCLVLFLFLSVLLVSCSDSRPPTLPSEEDASLLRTDRILPVAQVVDTLRVIPDRYLIGLKNDVNPSDFGQSIRRLHGGTLHHVYEHAFKGFNATLPEAAVAALQSNPKVVFIENDYRVRPHDTQVNAPWGLDRIDQRHLPRDGAYDYFLQAPYNIHVYVVDSGIATHDDLQSLQPGYSAVSTGGSTWDCWKEGQGHGTQVATIIGGVTAGVAKRVLLYPVRIAECGDWTFNGTVVDGLDWVTGHHSHPAVLNLSWGLAASTGSMMALDALRVHNVAVITSAGNSGEDACSNGKITIWPSRVYTVGASDWNDSRVIASPWTSNYGPCVRVFAPGLGIPAGAPSDLSALTTFSGTSAAAPHVTGVAAIILSKSPGLTADQLYGKLDGTAITWNQLSNIGSGSPNALLYSLHLAVNVAGESVITTSGSYTWEAMPSGGDGSYTYTWEYKPEGGSWSTVSLTKTYSRFVDPSVHPNFTLRVTVASSGDTSTGQLPVFVNDGSCGTFTC